jgi:hypothetical protein
VVATVELLPTPENPSLRLPPSLYSLTPGAPVH